MTPIEKNRIRVLDENGNPLTPTYIRRAEGLVKSRRAVYTSDNRNEIQLLPAEHTEELKMSEINTAADSREITEEEYNEMMNEHAPDENASLIHEILERIDAIRADREHLDRALGALEKFEINESPMGGEGDKARAQALLDIVRCRETTNQQALSILEKLLERVGEPPQKESARERMIMAFINNPTLPPEMRVAMFEKYIASLS